MKYKRPARSSIAIDRDAGVIDGFKDSFPGDLIPGVAFICDDGMAWLASHAIPDDAFIYLDPPYLMSTRSCQRQIYRYELSEDDHEKLLATIANLDCSIAISGYASRMYDDALSSWRKIEFKAMTRGGRQATECLWMNYPEPYELHDYRYLGSNFRQRERIKRRQHRWFQRLSTMPALERYAMLSVVDQLRSDNAKYDDVDRSAPSPLAMSAVIARNNGSIDATFTRATTPISDDAGDDHDHSAFFGDAGSERDPITAFSDNRSLPATIAIPGDYTR